MRSCSGIGANWYTSSANADGDIGSLDVDERRWRGEVEALNALILREIWSLPRDGKALFGWGPDLPPSKIGMFSWQINDNVSRT